MPSFWLVVAVASPHGTADFGRKRHLLEGFARRRDGSRSADGRRAGDVRAAADVALGLLDRRLGRLHQLGDGVQALRGRLDGLDAGANAVEQAGEVGGARIELNGGEKIHRIVDRRIDPLAGGEMPLGLLSGRADGGERGEGVAHAGGQSHGHNLEPFWEASFRHQFLPKLTQRQCWNGFKEWLTSKYVA